MRFWKRFGGTLIALLALAVMLTGTVMAAEPAQKGIEVQLNGKNLAFTDAVSEITGSRAVIIADMDALFGDATFKLLDSFAAYSEKQNALNNAAVSGKLDIEVADRTGKLGSGSVKLGASMEGVVGNKGAQLTGKVDLSGLAEALGASGGSPMEQAMITAMLESLSGMTAELRIDLDEGMLYFLLPTELTGEENTWCSLDFGAYQAELLGAMNVSQMAQLEGAGVQESLVWVMKNMPLDDVDASYAVLSELAGLYVDMLSDQAFAKSGNTCSAKTVLEDIVNLEVTLTRRGQDIVAMDIVMTASIEEDGTKMTMTMTEKAAPDKVTANISMTMEDGEMSVKLSMAMTCVPTRKAPEVAPTAGAWVVPMA